MNYSIIAESKTSLTVQGKISIFLESTMKGFQERRIPWETEKVDPREIRDHALPEMFGQ